MMGLEDSLKQLAEVWKSWSFGKKAFILVGALVSIIGFGMIITSPNEQNFSPVMTNLSIQDANNVTQALDAMRIPYKLTKDGSVVMVPSAEVHKVRMQLAGQGLPKGSGVGFEVFDDPGFGMTRFAEEVHFRRALEGELRRTLSTMDTIRDARVHIVLPKRSIFKETEEKATASVTLEMENGRRLSENTVSSVVHLVASSVDGLMPEEVTVVDATGRILARGGDEYGGLGSGLQQQRKFEQNLEERVTRMIERVVGMGRATVQVSAELDFTVSEFTNENYDPEGIAVRSEQTMDEQRAGDAAEAGQIPPPAANAAGLADQLGANGETRNTVTRNYEVSKTVRREVAKVPRVKRLSVAVLVDGKRELDANGAEVVVNRTPEELARLEDLVKNAVGFNTDRADEVKVVEMTHTMPEAISEAPPAEMSWVDWLNLLWKPVLGLLFFFLLLGVMIAIRRQSEGAAIPVLEQPRSVRELEAALLGRQAIELPPTAPGASAEAQDAATALRETRPDPEKAAAVIKGWLSEG